MKELHKDEIIDNRYKLVEKRGRGSYGEVWLARDLQLNINVAVKVYFALDDAGNEELRQEFLTSFELNHPNLLRSTYFGRNAERSYIVMPFCPTTSAQLIGCCNSHMAWEFVSDVANGLAYLHEKDIVHHDIKPDNILIGENGQFVISDFGISTQTRSTLRHNANDGTDNSGKAGGAIAYMGPEMFTEEPYSVANTDIWAFGASLFELVTGTLPFFGQGGVMQNNGAQLPEVSFEFVSHNLVDLIHACLAKEPWDRPMAIEIAQYASMVLADKTSVPEWTDYFNECLEKRVPIDNDPPEPKKNRWWISMAAAIALFVGIGMVLYFGDQREKNELADTSNVEDTLNKALTLADLKPSQATFLKVNGSEKPKPVTMASYDTLKVVNIDTDGMFTVKEDLPKWISISLVTDTSLVFHLEPNKTAEKRIKTLEIVSGDIVRKITIVQSPDKDKALKARLTPASNGLQSAPE